MTLETACVLAKEIVIGKRWPCSINSRANGATTVEINLNGCGEVLYNELLELCAQRGAMQVRGMRVTVT